MRISAGSESVSGINVVNLVSEQVTRTADDGSFSISAKPGDLLVITAVHLEVHRYTVDGGDFEGILQISMIPKLNTLDETIVNQYGHINAESLGIIPKGQKKYTPAERKLKTAGDFKPIHLLGLIGGSLQLDPIINAITGRTAMLKKEIDVETKEKLLEGLDLIDVEYFTNTLKIPSEDVDGFKRYVVEDIPFRSTVAGNDPVLMEFRLAELATNYKLILKN